MTIEICPSCESKNSMKSDISFGNIPGISEMSGVYTCEVCGFRGSPLIIENEKNMKGL